MWVEDYIKFFLDSIAHLLADSIPLSRLDSPTLISWPFTVRAQYYIYSFKHVKMKDYD